MNIQTLKLFSCLKWLLPALSYLFSMNAVATPTIFIGSQGAGTLTSERTAFQSAFGSALTLESFETAFTDAAQVDFPIGGPTSFTATLNDGTANMRHHTTFFTDGSFSLRTNQMKKMEFNFATGITAFGIDISDIDNGSSQYFSYSIDGGAAQFIGNGAVNNNKYFFGIVSDTTFNTMTFASNSADNSGFDRAEFGADSINVPEPSTVLIFGLGVAGLVVSRRKKT